MKTLLCLILSVLIVFNTVAAQTPSAHLQIFCNSSGVANMDSEAIGALHNEAVTFVLNNTYTRKNMTESELVKNFNEQFVRFFESKGISVQVVLKGSLEQVLQEESYAVCMQTERLSPEAKSMACALQQHMEEVAGGRYGVDEFVLKMDALRTKAGDLTNDSERMLCSMTASVAKHSALFWSKYSDMYFQQFHSVLSYSNNGKQGPDMGDEYLNHTLLPQQRVRWWAFAASDVYGAWNWGRFGGYGGGLAGVVALGLTGATWHSGSSLITQAAYNIFK